MKDFLARSVLAKVLMLGLLTLLLAIPLAMIGGLVHERGITRENATRELAQTHAGPQTLLGPVLAVPYVERWTEELRSDKGQVTRVAQSAQRLHLVFPERLALDGQLAPQERSRGIFRVLFYELDGTLSGHFPAFDPAKLPRQAKDSTLEAQAPVLVLGLGDLRGLQRPPALRLGEADAVFQPGTPHLPSQSALAGGIHAPLPAEAMASWRGGQRLPFNLKLALVGQQRLAMVPLGDDTTARLSSPWPHPSFSGEFLARQRTVGPNGFEAHWSVPSLVTQARAQLLQARPGDAPPGHALAQLDSFDVVLVEPQNPHSLSDRAVKYGLLFVTLVLAAAFLFEVFTALRLHPVQYALVGLSIALFFLLLLALSEKIAFGAAYASAAAASVALLAVYFSAVLHSARRGLALGGYVAVLYGALYGLLVSEDNALLLGALLLFGLLALLMLATRRIDWYALSAPKPAAA